MCFSIRILDDLENWPQIVINYLSLNGANFNYHLKISSKNVFSKGFHLFRVQCNPFGHNPVRAGFVVSRKQVDYKNQWTLSGFDPITNTVSFSSSSSFFLCFSFFFSSFFLLLKPNSCVIAPVLYRLS